MNYFYTTRKLCSKCKINPTRRSTVFSLKTWTKRSLAYLFQELSALIAEYSTFPREGKANFRTRRTNFLAWFFAGKLWTTSFLMLAIRWHSFWLTKCFLIITCGLWLVADNNHIIDLLKIAMTHLKTAAAPHDQCNHGFLSLLIIRALAPSNQSIGWLSKLIVSNQKTTAKMPNGLDRWRLAPSSAFLSAAGVTPTGYCFKS